MNPIIVRVDFLCAALKIDEQLYLWNLSGKKNQIGIPTKIM